MGGKRLLLIVAACAGLAAGCSKPASEAPAAVDLAAEAQAVRDRSAAWLQMAQARDYAGITNDMYAADAATMFDGSISHGTAEILASSEADNANTPNSTIEWSTTTVKVAGSGDLAYELGTFNFDPDGAGDAAAATGEYVTIWSKADGGWRAVVGCRHGPQGSHGPCWRLNHTAGST
ncbi:MAG: nuclear transport factor 2 family protein [Gammaproteobacteria bacterium]|nr:nuclear transport factor 2 family protein [Gammaproteobacteria bacterium]